MGEAEARERYIQYVNAFLEVYMPVVTEAEALKAAKDAKKQIRVQRLSKLKQKLRLKK